MKGMAILVFALVWLVAMIALIWILPIAWCGSCVFSTRHVQAQETGAIAFSLLPGNS